MDGFIPVTATPGVAVVQSASSKSPGFGLGATVTLGAAPTIGNTLVAMAASPDHSSVNFSQGSWTLVGEAFAGSGTNGPVRIYVLPVTASLSATTIIEYTGGPPGTVRAALIELTGTYTVDDTTTKNNTSSPSDTLAPTAGMAAILLSVVNGDSSSMSPVAGMTEFAQETATGGGQATAFNHRIIATTSGTYTAGSTSGGSHNGLVAAAFLRTIGDASWVEAPDTVDDNDATSDDVESDAISSESGAFWRGDIGEVLDEDVGRMVASIGMDDPGDVTILIQGGDADDWSDAATVVEVAYIATGSFTADDIEVTWDTVAHRYWRLVLDTAAQDIRIFEVFFEAQPAMPDPSPGKAILEIYVHDEDASRWGTATWATGPATGTEGIWSGAGWQDVTPQGVNAHIIWGSRQPSRGILAEQSPASWNVQTYDPERILDPGNFDGPFYPQLVAGVPIRISHDSMVIRTGIVDEWHYKLKRPAYQGQILASDSWSLLNQAMVPPDTVLSNTLYGRIRDAIDAAGIAVGGIPVRPSDTPIGPTIADWVEGAATDDATSVGEHVRIASSEVLWVPLIQADGSLGLRSWGVPLERGRTIEAPNLEDLEAVSHEEGTYSVVKVQVEDPEADPIIRKAAPMPRYGERVWERREPTIDPEGYADAILAERPWPGVQWVPGAIHCFTHDDVDNFGSLQIMERITLTVPGAVSVQGRILGGEVYVEHKKGDTFGARWIFYFAVATDGATAIGSTILVADGTGETLLDDMTETDFLEAD